MRRILIWSAICALLILSHVVKAQSTSDTWPVTQRCVADATKPPTDWHFDGTLLLSSFGKLHTYQQGWDTPHIQVFDRDEGRLSPDGRWYAVIKSQVTQTSTLVTTVFTHAITVYSTESNDKYTIPWENVYSAIHRVYGHRLYWLDNRHLLYSKGDYEEKWYVIDPFKSLITQWVGKFAPIGENDQLSPDGSLIFSPNFSEPSTSFANGQEVVTLPILNLAGWSPDSDRFAVYTFMSDSFAVDNLALYNRDGIQTDIVFHFSKRAHSFRDPNRTWSPDGRYLLFAAEHLYIVDMTEKTVIDTFIPIDDLTVAWSPTSKQFAMVKSYDRKREVQIFDLDKWARYVVAYHTGSVIGWRAD